MDKGTLAHTSWNCKYHIVFAPKYRRQIVYGRYKVEIGKIIRTLCERKGIEIIEAELCPDHIHMLVSIPPKNSVSEIMGYVKGKSSLMIFYTAPPCQDTREEKLRMSPFFFLHAIWGTNPRLGLKRRYRSSA